MEDVSSESDNNNKEEAKKYFKNKGTVSEEKGKNKR